MNKIKQLDEHLTNMIAAGEVVERPSTIIKELIENSIDAKSTHIEIITKNGGLDLIGVIDNGEGMTSDDLRMAFMRHSTSKISSVHDLNQIKTLGFRGEALPSIASVSKVVAISNQNQLNIDNSIFGDIEKTPSNQGTSIFVSELFYKTPARLKHLKSPQYEAIRNLSLIQNMALGYPEVAFTFKNDDQLVFQTSGNNDLRQVFYAIYGAQLTNQSKLFESKNNDFKITGLYVLPHHHRANRYHINLFINNRLIHYHQISNLITKVFRRYMPSDRFPTVVMKIETDAQLVDVNVHPNKFEVRLSKESDLLLLVEKTLIESLKNEMGSKDISQSTFEKPMVISFSDDDYIPSIPLDSQPQKVFIEPEVNPIEYVDPQEPWFEVHEDNPIKAPIRVIGQHHGNYILAQDDQYLYIFDQHASMERIEFEKVSQQLRESQFHQQQLLLPLVFENRVNEFENIDEVINRLHEFGIELEEFSSSDLILRSVPHWMQRTDPFVFINLLLDDLNHDIVSLNYNYLATKACHRSVRFNEVRSNQELQKIVDDLLQCQQPYQCPHGRATFVKAQAKDLLKEFSR